MAKNDPAAIPTPWYESTAAKIGTVVVGIAATAITARDAISRAFFKSMNKTENGAFADLQKTRDDEIGRIVAPARGNPKEGIPAVAVPTAMADIETVNKAYDTKLAERMEMLGIRKGPLAVLDEAKALKRHQWLEVIFATGAVASVAVGAMMALASSRKTSQEQQKLERETDGKGVQR